MATQEDKYFIDLNVQSGKGLTEMQKMTRSMQRLRDERKRVNKAFREGLITENQHARSLNRIQVGLKGLSSRYREASNEAAGLTKQGIRFRDKIAGSMTTALTRLGGAMAGAFAISRIQQFVTETVRLNAELSDSFADVQKTTGLTADKVRDLDSALMDIDTRTARTELLDLAQVAGRMNIEGSENIRNFVEQSNQIQVALGDILGEGSALTIARIAASYRESILGIGSSINELGNTTRAQENDIVDFLARLQGSAINLGISSSDIAAYGATFSAFGVQIESTGTAMSKILQKFVLDTGAFEEAAGLTQGSLTELIGREGVNEGFLGFVSALRDANPEASDFLARMKDLGIQDRRTGEAFQLLANNIDEYRRAQGIATTSTAEASSITAEYAIRNNNLAASLEKLNKEWDALFASGQVADTTQDIIDALVGRLRLLGTVADETGSSFLGVFAALQGGFGADMNQLLLDAKEAEQALEGTFRGVSVELGEAENKLKDLNAIKDSGDVFWSAKDQIEILRTEERVKELRLEMERLGTAADFSLISRGPIQSLGTPSGDDSGDGSTEDPIGDSILESIRKRIELLKEERDQITESTGGRSEIRRLTIEIEKEQAKLNELLGKAKKKTKEVKENIGGWSDEATKYVEILDAYNKRGQILDTGFDSTEDEDEFIDQLILDQNLAQWRAFQNEKTQIEADETAKREAIRQASVQMFSTIGNAIVTNAKETAQRRLQVELDLLEKLRLNNEISQEEYAELSEAARRREFEATKRARTAEAIINAAAAVVNALATGGAAAPFLAATAAGTAAAEIVTIQSAQYARGGMLQGDSHERGGIPVSVGGKRVVEAEGGEAIINRRSTEMFRPLLSRINEVGGGVKFAAGGTIPAAPSVSIRGNAPMIDYNKMAASFANVNIETSVVDIVTGLSNRNKVTQFKTL